MSGWKRWEPLPAGTTALEEGTEGASLFRIVRGEVAVRKADGERSITLATLGEGDYFGEMALFERAPRSASVVATEETELEELAAESFQAVLAEAPDLALELVRPLIVTLSSRLRRTSSSLLALYRLGEGCAASTGWPELARTVVRALSVAIPAADRAVFVRYNPFAEEEEELASSAPSAGAPRSALEVATTEGTTLRVESTREAAFSKDDDCWLQTAATLVSAATSRLAQSADAEALARLHAKRI